MPPSLTVTLVRHGTSEASAYRDRERALTREGRQEVRDLGEALRKAMPLPALVVCSPLVRAVQTAELLAVALGYGGVVRIDRALRPDSAAGGVIELLVALASRIGEGVSAPDGEPRTPGAAAAGLTGKAVPRVATGVALVAHEPILSSACQLLLGKPVAGLRRAEAVCLAWEPGSSRPARLLWQGCPS